MKVVTKLDPLSYSSANLLQNCTKKYFLHKIKKVDKDSDSEEDFDAFNIGKAFHKVLEDFKHERGPLKNKLTDVCKLFKVEHEQTKIHAMLLRYFDLHEKSGMKLVAAEFEIVTKTFIGYVDAILKDADGLWYICDLKTAARISDSLVARLKSDLQLNLYAGFMNHIAKQYSLNLALFAGCLYRVTTKSALRPSDKLDYDGDVRRHYASVESYEVEIPREMLNPSEAEDKHSKLYSTALSLASGKVKPLENYSYCDSYFRPCEYWSQCHGKTYTECKSDLVLKSSNEYN